jgi:hypothetical protein
MTVKFQDEKSVRANPRRTRTADLRSSPLKYAPPML